MKLSIITINYNNRDGLRRTIDSVVCQTWRDYEWIVIDGGSTDGSKELIELYHEHFAYWCSEPDNGIYHAMNKGVAHAHGEYVNFMNSGDTFYGKNVLQEIDDIQSDADIIVGRIVSRESHEILHKFNGSLFMQLYLTTLPHQGSFIRRALLNSHPYDEELRIVADWKFWIQTIIFDNVKVDNTNTIVALYDVTGISSGKDSRNFTLYKIEREKVRNEYFPYLLRKELEENWSLSNFVYTKYGEFLRRNNHFLFSVGWRILKMFVMIQKFFSWIIKH